MFHPCCFSLTTLAIMVMGGLLCTQELLPLQWHCNNKQLFHSYSHNNYNSPCWTLWTWRQNYCLYRHQQRASWLTLLTLQTFSTCWSPLTVSLFTASLLITSVHFLPPLAPSSRSLGVITSPHSNITSSADQLLVRYSGLPCQLQTF